MKLKIYEERSKGRPEKKWPLLKLRISRGGIELVSCSEDGEWIATLLTISDKGIDAADSAKSAIKCDGYDTDFAEWDNHDRIVKLKPGIL